MRRQIGGRQSSVRPKGVIGPYDFAWLLERIADFSAEEGSRRGAKGWGIQSAPPPLQLLIPEGIAIDPENGHDPFRALFFTDRGGILRGARQSLNQEPKQMFESMVSLTRQRRQEECDKLAAKEIDDAVLMVSANLESLESKTRTNVLGVVPEETAPKSPTSSRVSITGSPERSKKAQNPRRTMASSPLKTQSSQPVTMPIIWRLVLESGSEMKLTEADVAPFFGAGQPGQASPGWQPGARLLQVCFSSDFYSDDEERGRTNSLIYDYCATKTEAEVCHSQIHRKDEGANNYQRKKQFESMADRNLISAVPVLISQHMAYYYNLELLDGSFEFTVDNRGKLWLVDARNLNFIPCTENSGGPGGTGPGTTLEQNTKKLFRYMSEEALRNMEVSEDTGTKCQRMLEKMCTHYQAIKDNDGIDNLLRKHIEIPDLCVPVFIGTDRKSLVQKFGPVKASSDGSEKRIADDGADKRTGGHIRPPSSSRHHGLYTRPRRPTTAPQTAREHGCPARHIEMIQRPSSRPHSRHRKLSGRGKLSFMKDADTISLKTSASNASLARPSTAPKPTNIGFEIMTSLEMPRLLAGAGPYMLPEGPTLSDVGVGPSTLSAPMAGQQAQRTSTARAKLRLVKPRPGATKGNVEQGVKSSGPKPHITRSMTTDTVRSQRTVASTVKSDASPRSLAENLDTIELRSM